MKHQSMKNLLLFLLLVLSINQLSHAQIVTVSGKRISFAEMDAFLKKKMDSLGMPGISIAVINNGKIIYHRAIGKSNVKTTEKADYFHVALTGPDRNTNEKVDDQSIFEAASLSKVPLAYFVMKTVDKGLMSLDTPLYKYLPYQDIAQDDRYKLITARMVLCHTSGFPNWRRWYPPDSTLHLDPNELYIKFKPGTEFSYSGEAFEYLAMVVAHLYQGNLRTLDAIFQKEVAAPLGLDHFNYSYNPYLSRHMVNGQINGKPVGRQWTIAYMPGMKYAEEHSMDSTSFGSAYSLHTEAIGYARFVIALMNGTGLTKASFDEMLKAQVQLPKTSDMYTDYGDTAWSLGLAMEPTKYGTRYEHGGNNLSAQSGFMFFKKQKNGYVFFTNCDQGWRFNEKLEAFLTEGKQ